MLIEHLRRSFNSPLLLGLADSDLLVSRYRPCDAGYGLSERTRAPVVEVLGPSPGGHFWPRDAHIQVAETQTPWCGRPEAVLRMRASAQEAARCLGCAVLCLAWLGDRESRLREESSPRRRSWPAVSPSLVAATPYGPLPPLALPCLPPSVFRASAPLPFLLRLQVAPPRTPIWGLPVPQETCIDESAHLFHEFGSRLDGSRLSLEARAGRPRPSCAEGSASCACFLAGPRSPTSPSWVWPLGHCTPAPPAAPVHAPSFPCEEELRDLFSVRSEPEALRWTALCLGLGCLALGVLLGVAVCCAISGGCVGCGCGIGAHGSGDGAGAGRCVFAGASGERRAARFAGIARR